MFISKLRSLVSAGLTISATESLIPEIWVPQPEMFICIHKNVPLVLIFLIFSTITFILTIDSLEYGKTRPAKTGSRLWNVWRSRGSQLDINFRS